MRIESRRSFLKQLSTGFGIVGAQILVMERSLLSGTRRWQRESRVTTYTNPVYHGSMPDPFVLQHEGIYYAFGTTGSERKADGLVFTLLTSKNLVNWRELGGALIPPTPDTIYQYWAPEVANHDSGFYLYYAMGGKEPEKFELRVAVSDRPDGPYKDTGEKLLDCDNNRFTIDAHPFRDINGQWYLFYARNFLDSDEGFFPGTALVVDKLIGMKKLAGECRIVLRARYPWTLYEANRRMEVYGSTFNWHTIEGAFVRRHNGRYYCFYSGSNYQTINYGVDYAVADNILGPYAGQGREPRFLKAVPGRVRGPGHHSIVLGPDGKIEYVVYHAWDRAMKVRQMCIDKMEWTTVGPRCAGPTYSPQPVPKG